MSRRYEELDVYRRSFALALEIHKFSLSLPDIEKFALASQLRRAAMSICANIAEGHAKLHFSKAEFRRFLTLAMGSSEEMRVWLKFCTELGYVENDQWQKWDNEYDQISKMLNGLWKNV